MPKERKPVKDITFLEVLKRIAVALERIAEVTDNRATESAVKPLDLPDMLLCLECSIRHVLTGQKICYECKYKSWGVNPRGPA